MKPLIQTLALCLCLLTCAAPVLAKADYSFVGIKDANQVTIFLKKLKKAVSDGDKAAVAAMVSYPIIVTIDDADKEIANKAAFLADYDKIINDHVKKGIAEQQLDEADVFVNKQGVMVGNDKQLLLLPEGKSLRITTINTK